MTRVDALYVDPKGPYPALLGADRCWDEARDARTYDGPGPVVANPPCGPWGRLTHLYKGAEHECAPHAVQIVRKYGGVLEHPADSRLWTATGLPKPGADIDAYGGWTVRVDQVLWGHACVKPTWLYVVGCEPFTPTPPYPARQATHGIWYGRFERSGHVGPKLLGASKEIRRRTPRAFAMFLAELAGRCKV